MKQDPLEQTPSAAEEQGRSHPMAVEDLVNKARLASWAIDREKLAKAAPDFVMQLGLGDETVSWDAKEASVRKALDAFWPMGLFATELPQMHRMRQLQDVMVMNVSSYSFNRNPDLYADQCAFVLHEEHEEKEKTGTWTDDDGAEYDEEESSWTTNHVVVVSPRVVFEMRSEMGPYNDEDFNAHMEGTLYLSSNLDQMQKLIRMLREDALFQPLLVCGDDEFEDKLKRCFGEAYKSQEMAVAATKSMQALQP